MAKGLWEDMDYFANFFFSHGVPSEVREVKHVREKKNWPEKAAFFIKVEATYFIFDKEHHFLGVGTAADEYFTPKRWAAEAAAEER